MVVLQQDKQKQVEEELLQWDEEPLSFQEDNQLLSESP